MNQRPIGIRFYTYPPKVIRGDMERSEFRVRRFRKAEARLLVGIAAVAALAFLLFNAFSPPATGALFSSQGAPLPAIEIVDDDSHTVLEKLAREACILCAISRLRKEIASAFPGFEFLPPRFTDHGAIVGVFKRTRTILAHGRDVATAYRALRTKRGW